MSDTTSTRFTTHRSAGYSSANTLDAISAISQALACLCGVLFIASLFSFTLQPFSALLVAGCVALAIAGAAFSAAAVCLRLLADMHEAATTR